nr:MAG TPA: hypothetical protein [Bacteriophage sp.]
MSLNCSALSTLTTRPHNWTDNMHSSLFVWSYSAHPGYQKIIVERCESEMSPAV